MRKTNTHHPRKRFGQNFLQSGSVIQQIVSTLNTNPTDTFLEIGPGSGAITGPLLKSLNQLTAVEIDRDLSAQLKIIFLEKKLTIHTQDALDFDLDLFYQSNTPAQKIRVVGNLPYNLSTPLLFHFFKFTSVIKDMHFMFQKEVVDRLTAKPNQKAYGKLGIMAQYHCDIQWLFNVPREAFYPKPDVQSAFVRLIPHTTPPFPATNFTLFQTLVRIAFTQRRKTLRNALKSYLEPQDFIDLNIDPILRPEALTLSDFVNISNFVDKHKPLLIEEND